MVKYDNTTKDKLSSEQKYLFTALMQKKFHWNQYLHPNIVGLCCIMCL